MFACRRSFCYWICIKEKEQARDLHLGKGADVPWAILSSVLLRSELDLLHYQKVSHLAFYQLVIS